MTATALVTGGAQGIGKAIAARLVGDGFDVVIGDVNGDAVGRTAAEIGARAVELDVTDPASVSRCAEGIDDLAVLVNNAGVLRTGSLADTTVDDYRLVMDVNVLGPLLTTGALTEALAAGDGGAVVNIASMSARTSVPGTGVYSASKAAVVALTETAALELGPRGIRVNAVGPGRIKTEMTESRHADPAREERTAALIPVRRSGLPSDVADVVSFLASRDARYVTGQTLYVDGGLLLGTIAFFQAAQGG
ncbi:MAG TPA: SDR family NAD(P)-dependent oxidoreductase [Mycobacteriales bacterium]|nr:SDR family NAD(P)-dependent oxidoreductase [Mycobacteriales bacterium]